MCAINFLDILTNFSHFPYIIPYHLQNDRKEVIQMPRMLIVDDDIYLRKLVLTYAQLENFQCSEAENSSQALELLRHSRFDIIILDVMMPGQDGFETLAKIRESVQTPVIMLTARSEEYDKLLGFNLGADDYVPKPFSPKELIARVNAVLRRTGNKPQEHFLRFGGMTIDGKTRMVILDKVPVKLPPKEFDLLLKWRRMNILYFPGNSF